MGDVKLLWRTCRWHISTGLDKQSEQVKNHSRVCVCVCEGKDKVVAVHAKQVLEIVEV